MSFVGIELHRKSSNVPMLFPPSILAIPDIFQVMGIQDDCLEVRYLYLPHSFTVVGKEGLNGRPPTALPSDKSHGLQMMRPNRLEGNGRPKSRLERCGNTAPPSFVCAIFPADFYISLLGITTAPPHVNDMFLLVTMISVVEA